MKLIASGIADNTVRGAIGFIVTTAEAFAAGIGSLPTPLDDAENDWYVWEPFVLMSGLTDTADDDRSSSVMRLFDTSPYRAPTKSSPIRHRTTIPGSPT